MHGKHIHVVIVCGSPFKTHPVTESRIVNHMIGTDKPREAERLAGGIKSDCPVFCILRNRLRRDMPVTGHNNITPDFIRDHEAVIGRIDFHGFLDFPSFPDATARIVRRTENGKMNMVLSKLTIHILIVHAPDS